MIPEVGTIIQPAETPEGLTRRQVLQASAVGALGIMGLAVGVPIAGTILGPAFRSGTAETWSDLGPLDEFPAGKMVEKLYEAAGARTELSDHARKTAYVLRKQDGNLQVLSPSCTHLGCPVRWAENPRKFLCPCHGGVFDENGRVTGGPPKRPLVQLETRVRDGRLFLKEPA